MRLLLCDPPAPSLPTAPAPGTVLDQGELTSLYAAPATAGGWLRANFAASLDGAITGPDGRSGSVNTEADHVVFELVRALSDAVVVGAGTVRGEGYTALAVDPALTAVRAAAGLAPDLPLVVVTGRGELPPTLHDAPAGSVLLATTSSADGLARTLELLGDEHVLLCGTDHVEHRRLVDQLHERSLTRLLTEGGPGLLSSMLAAGVVDELCLSVTPLVVGGDSPRVTHGPALTGEFTPRVLVEQDGTVMGRWVRSDHR